MSNERYYIYEGTKEVTLSDIIGVFRAAVKEGGSFTDDYSGPFGAFALRKGPYVLYSPSRDKFGIGKIVEGKEETTIEYVELTEDEFEILDDISKNGRRF